MTALLDGQAAEDSPAEENRLRVVSRTDAAQRGDRVVWKFGGTSVGDPARLRAVAERLVAARREGLQVVAVLSAMGDSTDELLRLAHEMSPHPHPRELDALLSVGETMSCALAAIAVHDLGQPALSLTGAQAGMFTDSAHGNARLRRVSPERILSALDDGAVVLVSGFQGQAANGDVTTLGRGGSDASAIAVAAALGLSECHIFTDVPGVFTADPRVVPNARMLTSLTHDEMIHLADAGARVLQTRSVELAAAHGVDIHVRSSFTFAPGTWIRGRRATVEGPGIAGVAHLEHDPVYTVTGLSPAKVSAALGARCLPIGSITRDPGVIRFTAPATAPDVVIATLSADGADVAVHDELGSVSVVSGAVGDRPAMTAAVLSTLECNGIDAHLVTGTPSRITCHVPAGAVRPAARLLHDAFELGELPMSA
jgi:aspartate kinase